MANAQYWREQAEMLRRMARIPARRHRRIPPGLLPLRLRLRCDPASAHRVRQTNDAPVMPASLLAG
jgi:hypothetical protein